MSAYPVPAPENGETKRSRHFVVVFYDRNGVVVTTNSITRGVHRYDVADIHSLGKSTGTLHPGVWAALAIGAGAAVVVIASATAIQTVTAWAVAIVALLIPWGVALSYALRWPRELRLLADYRNVRVTLLCTRDKQEFGQISRAVQRALEFQQHSST